MGHVNIELDTLIIL